MSRDKLILPQSKERPCRISDNWEINVCALRGLRSCGPWSISVWAQSYLPKIAASNATLPHTLTAKSASLALLAS